MILLARPLAAEIAAYTARLAARLWQQILIACAIVETSVPDAYAATTLFRARR